MLPDRSLRAADVGQARGVVRFQGTVPKSDVLDAAGKPRDLLTVDAKSGGLRDVVVYWIDAPSEPIRDPKKLSDVVIDQNDFVFVPHLASVRAGQSVKFTNSDSSNHNVRAAALEAKNQFNVLTAPGNDYVHRFASDKKQRPTRIGCDIHPWMSAWIYAFDHPFHTVTDAKGQFELPQLPPGTYRLAFRQPDGNLRRDITVEVSVKDGASVEVIFREADLSR